MPKKQTPTAARRAREAVQAGGKYTEALREAQGTETPAERRFALARQMFADGQAALRELNQDAPEDRDPWRRAALLDSRAGVWMELAQAAPDSTADEFRQASHYAAILDQEQAARIRYAAAIPTLFPATQHALLHLDEMRCQRCGQPWQSDQPCEHCPRILWGASPKSAEQAATLPAGELWRRADDERQDDELPAPELFGRAAAERPETVEEIQGPRWYIPGRTDMTLSVLNRLFHSADPFPIGAGWRFLVEELAETRGDLVAQQAALEAVRKTRAALQQHQRNVNPGIRRTLGLGAAEEDAARIGNALERARLRYVQLAVHALAAAASEASPLVKPEQVPLGDPGFTEPTPVIPESLAARGYALTNVHNELPTAGLLIESLQDDFEREFGRSDDHECNGLVLDGRCDCDPISVPEHMMQTADALQDEIVLAAEAEAEEQVLWADAVCIALATELRVLLRD